MIDRITDPTGDDWIVRLRCRAEGRQWTVWRGVNGQTEREAALKAAIGSVNTPKRVHCGRAADIYDVEIHRMFEWRARQLAAAAPEHFAREIGGWQNGARIK